MLVAIGVTGFVLSLGHRTPVYGWLYRVFPPMQGLRAAARFGNLFLLGDVGARRLGLAMLRPAASAAARAAMARRRCRRSRMSNRCARRSPIAASPASRPLHAARGRAGTSCSPKCRSIRARRSSRTREYVLNSTAHWRPLMNGYSGYTPAPYCKSRTRSGIFRATTRSTRCGAPA